MSLNHRHRKLRLVSRLPQHKRSATPACRLNQGQAPSVENDLQVNGWNDLRTQRILKSRLAKHTTIPTSIKKKNALIKIMFVQGPGSQAVLRGLPKQNTHGPAHPSWGAMWPGGHLGFSQRVGWGCGASGTWCGGWRCCRRPSTRISARHKGTQ